MLPRFNASIKLFLAWVVGQFDDIWSFCYAKQKNLREEYKRTFGYGDVWTFTALCADTKLVPTWRVRSRDVGTATDFMQDLASRLTRRAQVTTDGHSMYLDAVEDAFGANVDYAMLQKMLRGRSRAAEAVQSGQVHRDQG